LSLRAKRQLRTWSGRTIHCRKRYGEESAACANATLESFLNVDRRSENTCICTSTWRFACRCVSPGPERSTKDQDVDETREDPGEGVCYFTAGNRRSGATKLFSPLVVLTTSSGATGPLVLQHSTITSPAKVTSTREDLYALEHMLSGNTMRRMYNIYATNINYNKAFGLLEQLHKLENSEKDQIASRKAFT